MANRSLQWASILVIGFAILALLPAFSISLGLPTEGDAVSYRVPILKWMLRHGTYPNWSWTYVDDYPMLGELLMLPFFAIKESLARIVPMFFYMASATFAAALSLSIFPSQMEERKKQFLFSFACSLSLHPLLLQSNAFMVDNIASTFSLAALYFCLEKKTKLTIFSTAMALATRYSVWGFFPGVFFANFRLKRNGYWMIAIALLGAAPFLLRNQILNQNPFFPLFQDWLYGQKVYSFDSWGRGKGLVAFLLFPFDLLFTNSFVNPFFDIPLKEEVRIFPYHFTLYTVGFFFQILVAAAVVVAIKEGRRSIGLNLKYIFLNPKFQATIIFMSCHFFTWWFGSQQLRFLGPELLLTTSFLSVFLLRRSPKVLNLLVLSLGICSIANVHLHSWKLAAGRIMPDREQAFVQEHLACIQSLQLQAGEIVGLKNPAFILGYGNYDFMYLPPYPHYFPSRKVPDYLVDEALDKKISGYELWPRESPCAFRKVKD